MVIEAWWHFGVYKTLVNSAAKCEGGGEKPLKWPPPEGADIRFGAKGDR